jgi:hypothetical protein
VSARSNIARKNADGSFDSIYCHWDSHPSRSGVILLQHYSNPVKLNALLSLGDLSSLGAEIGEKHDFDEMSEGVCTFYGRDRGETGVEAKHFANAEEMAAMLENSWTEWVYIFQVADGKWHVTNNPSPTWFKCCGSSQRAAEELTLACV